jgi:hypothetical protein
MLLDKRENCDMEMKIEMDRNLIAERMEDMR